MTTSGTAPISWEYLKMPQRKLRAAIYVRESDESRAPS